MVSTDFSAQLPKLDRVKEKNAFFLYTAEKGDFDKKTIGVSYDGRLYRMGTWEKRWQAIKNYVTKTSQAELERHVDRAITDTVVDIESHLKALKTFKENKEKTGPLQEKEREAISKKADFTFRLLAQPAGKLDFPMLYPVAYGRESFEKLDITATLLPSTNREVVKKSIDRIHTLAKELHQKPDQKPPKPAE